MRGTIRAALAFALAAAGAVAGCGGRDALGDRVHGTKLTIYASAPMHGASHVEAGAVLSGEQLALAQIGGRIGRYRVVLRPLDDSTPTRQQWDPGQTTVNAREAIADPTTIGYLGELNSGASAISIPLLNRSGIPQISPSSTAVGLTSAQAGAAPGEPQKYYPTGKRTYVRVVPSDAVQATAQARLQKSLGCTTTYVLDDGEFDGQDMASSFILGAASAGLRIANVQSFDPYASDYSSLAANVAQSGANCVLISAIVEPGAVHLTRQVAGALPNATIFVSSGLAESSFADPAQGGIPAALDGRVLVTAAPLGSSRQLATGRQFAHTYGSPQPWAGYGYEAMSLLLSAIDRATDRGTRPARRSQVLTAIFDTRGRRGVLGTYSVEPDGDTTLRGYGVYRIVAGELRLWRTLSG